MSEYAQTQRRFEKLKATFDKLIEENSYKTLRKRIAELKEEKKVLYQKLQGFEGIVDAHMRIIKSLEEKIKNQEQVRAEAGTTVKES